MVAYCKIGFHTSPAGNKTGLGDWMRALDAQDIPFFIKAADEAGPVFEGQELAKASGVPHVLAYRKTGLGWDLPDYSRAPAEAAQGHWERHRDSFPPELDKSLVWLETVNEVDRARSDWLGEFAYHTGLLALRDGYRWAAFGWSSGEPERQDWETPGMLDYLALCADHPDQLAVALHEYSYTVADIMDGFPDKLGRFQALFEVCDRLHIRRPTVLITEWGWEYNRVPNVTAAMAHIRATAELYARHRQILGAALWHLGGGFMGIADQAQRLIQPLRDFSLNTAFPGLPLDDDPGPVSMFLFLADVTIPDGAAYNSGDGFLKTWRIKNAGNTTWDSGFTLVFIDGEQMGGPDSVPLPAAVPGEEIDVSVQLTAPDAPGVYRSFWQPRDGAGHLFGRAMWAEIEVHGDEEALDQYQFVADVTIPDGARTPPGQEFVKTWRLRNVGTSTWKKNYQLAFLSGTQMGAPSAKLIMKNVEPDAIADISVTLQAPSAPGDYHGNWCLRTHQGEVFGPIIWVAITVPPGLLVADGFYWPVGNRSNLEGWADVNPFLRRNGQGEYHPGADFNDMGWGDHDLGAPVYAAAHGLVTAVGFWPIWGNLVLIEHQLPDGSMVWTQYAHLRELLVQQGAAVQRGQRIGTIGKGDHDRYWAHLHFEVRRTDFHVASWLVHDPLLVQANYWDPMRFIRDHFAPV